MIHVLYLQQRLDDVVYAVSDNGMKSYANAVRRSNTFVTQTVCRGDNCFIKNVVNAKRYDPVQTAVKRFYVFAEAEQHAFFVRVKYNPEPKKVHDAKQEIYEPV